MPDLSARERARLPDSAFAYVDSRGRRLLPIHDEAHVRNALARFSRTNFEDDAARDRARRRLLRAARRHGISQVLIPHGNVRDIDDLPAEVRETIRFHPVRTMDDVLAVALRAAPAQVGASEEEGHRVSFSGGSSTPSPPCFTVCRT
jgi:hypothetical protein